MQIQVEDIKRPKLIESFFNVELLPDNSYATYINTTSQKKCHSCCHNIKKSLKSKKFNVALSHKYHQVRLRMNENRFISVDGVTVDFDEYIRGVRLKSLENISRNHLTTCRV